MIEKDNENKEKPPKTKGEARFTLVKGLLEDAKGTFLEIKNKRKIEGLDKISRERAIRKAILASLIVLEFVPAAEATNEATKDVNQTKEVLKKIKGKAPEAVKMAKTKGLIGDLYPNVPDWFVSSMAALDGVGIPFIGVAPDAIQLIYDRAMEIKDEISVSRETVSTFRQLRNQRKELINQAVSDLNNLKQNG